LEDSESVFLFWFFMQVNVKMMMEADGWNLNEGAGVWKMN